MVKHDAPTKHVELLKWIRQCAALCQPDRIVWVDGSEEQKQKLTKEAVATGEGFGVHIAILAALALMALATLPWGIAAALRLAGE